MKIICDNKIPFLKGVLEPYAQVLYLPGKETTPEVVRDADALITRTRTICNESLLEGSRVKAIATATIGFDHIDTAWCESNGIFWTNAPGCNSASVAQYITAALAVLCKKYSLNFENLTLGVVGVGNVGSKVAARAKAIGMKVLLNDPPRVRREGPEGFVTLDEIISKSDIITVHVPLNTEGPDNTVHLFDARRISDLRQGQILINSSRGQVVDNAALKNALLSHRIRAAVLDVWETEPVPDAQLLAALEIATPHIAGYSADGKANGTGASVRAIATQLGIDNLKDWKVQDVPAPLQSLKFSIDAATKTKQAVLTQAILHTYDIEADSNALKTRPQDFEKLRGDYQVRREFTAFTVDLKNGTQEVADSLQQLGFNVNRI